MNNVNRQKNFKKISYNDDVYKKINSNIFKVVINRMIKATLETDHMI